MNTLPFDSEIWREAAERVDHHLRAYRMEDRRRRRQWREEIIARAAARHAEEPARAPVELAAEETERHLRAWIDRLLGPTAETPRRRFARGRAAVYLANLPGAAAGERDDPPPEWVDAVRAIRLEAAPEVTLGSMVPHSLDLGLVSGMARGAWQVFARWPVLRGVTICVVSASLLGTAFYLVHP